MRESPQTACVAPGTMPSLLSDICTLRQTMKTKLSHRWAAIYASFWFVPSLMVVCAAPLAILTTSLDIHTDTPDSSAIKIFQDVSQDGAREILSMIAQSVISVTSVAFSITILILTLASSQFGPRLLRNFITDTSNHLVLGTFISTFVYCLLALRIISTSDIPSFIPSLSVSLAVLLALICMGALIYFIHHVATAIQADHVLAKIRRDLEHHIENTFPSLKSRSDFGKQVSMNDASFITKPVHSIAAAKSGYLQVIDRQTLVEVSKEYDLLIKLQSMPGDFIILGTPLMSVVADRPQIDKALTRRLIKAFYLGSQRTPEQDPEFALRQLVEIAIRALSPSLNDPFTAMSCIDHLGAILSQVAQRDDPPSDDYDDGGKLRVIGKPILFPQLVDCAFDQIRNHARANAAVTMRLLEIQKTIVTQTRTQEQRSALLRQAQMIERLSQEALPERNDREKVGQLYVALCESVDLMNQERQRQA